MHTSSGVEGGALRLVARTAPGSPWIRASATSSIPAGGAQGPAPLPPTRPAQPGSQGAARGAEGRRTLTATGARPHAAPAGPLVGGGGSRNTSARWTLPLPSSPRPRAMVQNRCKQIKAVTRQLLPSLQSKEERERKAAILILTEVRAWAGRGSPSDTASSSSCLGAPIRTLPGRTRLQTTVLPPPSPFWLQAGPHSGAPGWVPCFSGPCQPAAWKNRSLHPSLPGPTPTELAGQAELGSGPPQGL